VHYRTIDRDHVNRVPFRLVRLGDSHAQDHQLERVLSGHAFLLMLRICAVSARGSHLAARGGDPAADQLSVTAGAQRCGSNLSMRLLGCVGSRARRP